MVVLYTDGSCSAKDRAGGWAYYSPSHPSVEASGYANDTTISRMELMAAIRGLIHVGIEFGPSEVKVCSDSQYVVLGITDRGRQRNCNQDLWGLLDQATDSHKSCAYVHVRGHTGEEGNERADKLAGEARKIALKELKKND